MLKHFCKNLIWYLFGVCILIGFVMLVWRASGLPTNFKICQHTTYGAEYDCHTYSVGNYILIKLAQNVFDLTFIAALVTAIATAFIARFTITLARVGQNQISDTKILQRAYIAAEPLGVGLMIEGKKVIGHIGIVNAGNLPAKNLAWYLTIKESGRGDETHFPLKEPTGKIIVVPKATAIRGSDDAVSFDKLSRASDKTTELPQYLYVWGVIRYDDGFENTRTTKFCHRYNWRTRGEGGVKAIHPNFSIAPQYARYHEHGNDAD